MNLSTRFDFVEGDTLTKIKTVMADEDTQVPIDLSGGTVTVRMRFVRPGDGAVSTPVDRAMTVTDAVNGACEYEFQSGELTAGTMRVEVSAVLADGKRITTKRYTEFIVRPRL